MRYSEIDLFGIYIAPMAAMLVAAWIITFGLRLVADRFHLLHNVWHPPLVVAAVYIIVLSLIVLLA
ncbi:MAG: DUF1656 domain-containing protein [Rhizobiales bacterium]|nr:DUF1656 domain-containing protein [Hyphomicrobiales bacterium]OJY04873.1 MAG: DUF1656 domain-containing protein [Rhizobiales bacterium 63-22]